MASSSLIDLRGQIERITYSNEENGYTVARVRVAGRKGLVTVTGNLFNPAPGEVIDMQGRWSSHPRYGEQFEIAVYRSSIPASVQGMERYLGSGLIKGIGPVMAKRIVKNFREKTFDIIEGDITRLAEVDGIGEKRIEMIRKAWEEQKQIRSVMIFLQTHGVSTAYAVKIFRQYGDAAIHVVQENPYRLAADIFGIGFLTADKIAEKLGFARDSQLRAEEGVLYVLNELADDGHVYYPRELLLDKCVEMLGIDLGVVAAALDVISRDKRIVIEEVPDTCAAEGKAVYLAPFYLSETSVAARLKILINTAPSLRKIDAEKAIRWVQEKLLITLAVRQIEAIRSAGRHKVLVITGGPGTGKTTIISAILRIFSAARAGILLAAPTGRAAKRMTEATGWEAKTIHRMLEYSFQKGGFQRNDDHPLDCNLMIVDEASMIDTVLMHHLLKAIPPEATLILVGDVNQLPSVGAGNVLKDIIDSGSVAVIELNEIFRQSRQSSIVVNAHRINQGEMPWYRASGGQEDFYFIEQEEPERVLQVILDLVKNRIPRRFGFDPIDGIQVLTPMHKGQVGAGNLNVELQKVLNPGREGPLRGGRSFRVGDKVMQIRNNYGKDVFNGDIGRIVRFDDELQELTVSFDGRRVEYDYKELDEIVLAYACSVHKAQGSEYQAVVMPVLTQHYVLLQRNLLYTGVTRGKKLVVLIGTKRALAIAVRNDKTQKRYTLLRQRLTA
ncbi:MAG: ATP-dependent RecD-like DNA helicase [Deltaproteobacteria bacterium]|nr:ATP-dependent RecD-like DNA helicase [Deltaproteobacteria bacterium]